MPAQIRLKNAAIYLGIDLMRDLGVKLIAQQRDCLSQEEGGLAEKRSIGRPSCGGSTQLVSSQIAQM